MLSLFYNRKVLKAWKTLKKKLSEDTIVLIDSDPEMKKGLNTRHGFYSLNKRVKIEHPDITGFYGSIKLLIEK
jgi:hypothetical protein